MGAYSALGHVTTLRDQLFCFPKLERGVDRVVLELTHLQPLK